MTENPDKNEYLTTREVAELLRLKERKVYDLAAEKLIPCTPRNWKTTVFKRGGKPLACQTFNRRFHAAGESARADSRLARSIA